MPAERRGQVIAVGIGATGNGRSPMINGRRQPSSDGTSRMTRECQVRICEGLEVQFLGPTRPSASESLVEASKAVDDVETGAFTSFREEHGGYPTYWPCDVRCIGGVTLIRALLRNLRTCLVMRKEKAQAEETRGRKYQCASQGRTAPL